MCVCVCVGGYHALMYVVTHLCVLTHVCHVCVCVNERERERDSDSALSCSISDPHVISQ